MFPVLFQSSEMLSTMSLIGFYFGEFQGFLTIDKEAPLVGTVKVVFNHLEYYSKLLLNFLPLEDQRGYKYSILASTTGSVSAILD